MNLADEFRRWLADPARTVDELCAAEVILEWGERLYNNDRKLYQKNDWNVEQRRRKERAGNPAYRPKIKKDLIEHALEFASAMKHFQGSNYQDRPIRSLEPLRFFPSIEHVSADAEVTDLSPLHALPNMKHLALHEPHAGGHVIKDLSGLAGLKVESVSISLRTPWPDVRALSEMPGITKFAYRGNLVALRDVGPLAKVTNAVFEPDFHCNTPAKDFTEMPAMPVVKNLRVNSIADLKGIQELSGLLSLDVVGPFQDLSPLEKVPSITWLRLEGNRFMDLSPLARMPQLRELIMVREHPLDLSPLSESVSLREVAVERCAIIRTELSALNAGFVPWGQDFLAPEPRPVGPLRMFMFRIQDEDVKAAMAVKEEDPRAPFYGDDAKYAAAEARWFARELQQRLDTLLGQGWGDADSYPGGLPGYRHLTLQRFRDIMRLEEVLQTTRELMAACKFPWQMMVICEPHGDLSKDMEEIRAQREEQERDWLDRDYDAEQEKEDYEEFQKMRRELYERLEREHRLRLLQQQGEEINPADFSPSAPKPKVKKQDDEDDDDEDFEDDDEGDLADFEDEPEQTEFEEAMSFSFFLTENHIWVTEGERETFEATLGVRVEDWHALPEPVLERPRPRTG